MWDGGLPLRLVSVGIGHFGSIQDQWLPLGGLAVLFGPNSAGKTSVLEAIEHLIAQERDFQSDPGRMTTPLCWDH
jgi:predicted ATP-dependent endonuclease of OLD family